MPLMVFPHGSALVILVIFVSFSCSIKNSQSVLAPVSHPEEEHLANDAEYTARWVEDVRLVREAIEKDNNAARETASGKSGTYREAASEYSSSAITSDEQAFGNVILSRRYSTSRLAHRSIIDKPYVVAYIFAGRQDRMHLLMNYMDQLLVTDVVDEVHLWDRTRNNKDESWVRNLSHGLVKVLPRQHGWLSIYEYYSPEGHFKPVTGEVPNTAVFVKMDDDIVFVDTSTFRRFASYIVEHPDMFIVHANIVNNGVAAYYQSRQIKELGEKIPATKEYPLGGMYGKLLQDGEEGAQAAALHRFFLDHREAFSWEDSTNDNCIKFHAPDMDSQGRFSINFFGSRRDKIKRMCEFIKSFPSDDEHALTTLATQSGLRECIFTPFNVAHLAFSTQPKAVSMLSAYEDLWKNLSGASNKILHEAAGL